MEGFDRSICVSRFGLELHIGIGDLRNGREQEDGGEREAKASNGEVNPLHVLQRLLALSYANEDDIGAKDWSNNGPDTIERLGDVDPELRISRRSTDSNVRVRGSLERTKAIPDYKYSGTKASKRLMQDAWPGD